MKTYLLICFILLFYSINSITKENCEKLRDSCNAHCETYPKTPDVLNCRRFCSRKSYECFQKVG